MRKSVDEGKLKAGKKMYNNLKKKRAGFTFYADVARTQMLIQSKSKRKNIVNKQALSHYTILQPFFIT
jgi:hypothetical protein